MLPFLKPKDSANVGVIVKHRAPDEAPESEKDDSAAAIESCAQALISAIHAKDVKAVSEALKDAFEILESMPHEESAEPHSYSAQNAAAKGND